MFNMYGRYERSERLFADEAKTFRLYLTVRRKDTPQHMRAIFDVGTTRTSCVQKVEAIQ